MANSARKYTYAESLGTSTSTANTDTTKVTLTFTPDANSDYVYIWNADVAINVTTDDVVVTLKNNAGTALGTSNWEAKDTTDFTTLSGIAKESFGASPTSQSITLAWRNETSGRTASIRNARIFAIKLTAADAFAENTADSSTTSTTLQTATTLTFTPASTGDYLIIGSCEARSSVIATRVNTQITYSATAYSAAGTQINDITNYASSLMQASVGTLTTGSKSITLQYSSGTSGTTVNCRNAKLLALRLDEFSSASITTDTAAGTTTSTTYVTKTTTGALNTLTGLQYLVIGSATAGPASGAPTTVSVGYGLSVGGTYVSERLVESPGTYYSPGNYSAFSVVTAGNSLTVNMDYDSEAATVTNQIDEVTLSVLLLEPSDLYWVGGTGTWNSSTATNWALTSGGTGGVSAPKSGTNVNFDANSDSGAGFTVTVGTGATCRNLTASGLDNTMTLSGTAAASVYGNFSVPATNFTQSYTGTITFASNASQTITTNGKSFTAFTFDGVGGTWTLQDALTLTGAATLTNGTLALGTYTLTCDNWNSNNVNTRTINFGTGKIVVTSASTATVVEMSNVGSLTVSGTPLIQLTGGGATTKTINLGAATTEAQSISVQLSTTAGTVTFLTNARVRNLTIDNNSFTLSNTALNLFGNLLISGTTPTLTAGANTWTFIGTSTQTITTNGKTLDFPITFNGVGATYSLQDNLTVGTTTARTVTLSNGTIELNSSTFTIYGQFITTGTSVRRMQMSGTGGKIVLSLDTTITVYSGSDTTNMTTDGNVLIQLTGGGATTKTIASGSITEANAISFQISTTAGTTAFSVGNVVKNLTIDNNNFTFSNINISIYGDLSIAGTLPTLTAGANAWTFAATSGTKTITTNAKTLDFPLTFDGVGGTWSLVDNLTVGTTTSRTVTLTNGTLDTNSKDITLFGIFSSSNSNTRSLKNTGGAGKIVMTLDTATTVWVTTTVTNMTTDGLVVVRLTGGGATTKTISTGALSEANSISFMIASSAGTVAFTASNTVKNLTLENTAYTLSNIAITIYGNVTIVGGLSTLNAGANAWTFAATSGTKTISTTNATIDWPLTFNGVGGTWSLSTNVTVGVPATLLSRAITLTNGTLDYNSKTLTHYGAFVSNNSNTRALKNTGGTGKHTITYDQTLVVWNTATVTGMTTDGLIIVRLTGGGVGTKSISAGALSESNSISFEIACTAGTVAFTASNTVENLTLENTTFTLSNVAITVYGNFTIAGSSPTLTAGSNTWTFAATSGTKTITTNTKTIDWPLTFDGVGGTWSLVDNLTVGAGSARDVTVTNGTLDINSKTLTLAGGAFLSTNSNTRRIQTTGGSGSITITTTSGTIYDTSIVTGLTTDGNIILVVSGAGATTRTVRMGQLSEANAVSLTAALTDPSGGLTLTADMTIKNLLVNMTNTFDNNPITVYGNFTTTTISYSASNNLITFAGSGTQILTTNGNTISRAIAFTGTGTYRLAGALTIDRRTTFTQGTLNLNNFDYTTSSGFDVTGTSSKVLAHGTGNLIISLGSTTAFNATGSNLTSTGTGVISMTAATAKTFVGGGNSYNTLSQDGAGALTISGSNTFKNIRNTVQPVTVTLTSGTTQTLTENFGLQGILGSIVTLNTTTTSAATLSKSSGMVKAKYINISYNTATGGATWFGCTDDGAVDGGNNTGWIFAPCSATGNFLLLF